MDDTKVGVLGLGQGRSHLRAFQALEGSRVVAVCDTNEALAGQVCRDMGVPRRFLRAIREDGEPGIGPREVADSIVPLICALQSADQGGGSVPVPQFT